jgi:hypothetical protein
MLKSDFSKILSNSNSRFPELSRILFDSPYGYTVHLFYMPVILIFWNSMNIKTRPVKIIKFYFLFIISNLIVAFLGLAFLYYVQFPMAEKYLDIRHFYESFENHPQLYFLLIHVPFTSVFSIFSYNFLIKKGF